MIYLLVNQFGTMNVTNLEHFALAGFVWIPNISFELSYLMCELP